MKLPTGYTSGPWRVFINDSGGEWSGWPLSIDAVNEVDKTVVRPGGQWPYEWDEKTSKAEALANAKLIALAPDMADWIEREKQSKEDAFAELSSLLTDIWNAESRMRHALYGMQEFFAQEPDNLSYKFISEERQQIIDAAKDLAKLREKSLEIRNRLYAKTK